MRALLLASLAAALCLGSGTFHLDGIQRIHLQRNTHD